MSKPVGLAAFAAKATTIDTASEPLPSRSRGRKETVAITVRLSRPQWERLHQFAVAEGISLQQLTVQGLSTLLRSKGLPIL